MVLNSQGDLARWVSKTTRLEAATDFTYVCTFVALRGEKIPITQNKHRPPRRRLTCAKSEHSSACAKYLRAKWKIKTTTQIRALWNPTWIIPKHLHFQAYLQSLSFSFHPGSDFYSLLGYNNVPSQLPQLLSVFNAEHTMHCCHISLLTYYSSNIIPYSKSINGSSLPTQSTRISSH